MAANIWTNPGDDTFDGIDNDDNGFVDDVHGYDFVNDVGDSMDDNGHGTHVAGTIGAVGNNGEGVTGLAWNTQLMALKFMDSTGSGTMSNAVATLNYATMMKKEHGVNIRVTNNSWGVSEDRNPALEAAIRDQGAANILVVAAAGNGDVLGHGVNNDFIPFYPAS